MSSMPNMHAPLLEKKPSVWRRSSDTPTLNFDERTQIVHEGGKAAYHFDFSEPFGWPWVLKMRSNNEWSALRHPLVVHFINEKLLDFGGLYMTQIFGYFSFLLVLCWNVLYDPKSDYSKFILAGFTVIFIVATIYKVFLRRRNVQFRAYWSSAGLRINVLTILTTILFLWMAHFYDYCDNADHSTNNANSTVSEVVSEVVNDVVQSTDDNATAETGSPCDNRNRFKGDLLKAAGVAVTLCAWANCLYMLRLTAAGIYVVMLVKVFHTFARIILIVIPTMVSFTLIFRVVLIDSNVEPWKVTGEAKSVDVMQWLVETLLMMIGEVHADGISETRNHWAIMLLLVFVPFLHLLFTGFVVAVTVGDVTELQRRSDDELLHIKLDAALEMHLAIFRSACCGPLVESTNEVLVIKDERIFYSATMRTTTEAIGVEKAFVESELIVPPNRQNAFRRLKQWLLGLNLPAYLEKHAANALRSAQLASARYGTAGWNHLIGMQSTLLEMERMRGAHKTKDGRRKNSAYENQTPLLSPNSDPLNSPITVAETPQFTLHPPLERFRETWDRMGWTETWDRQ